MPIRIGTKVVLREGVAAKHRITDWPDDAQGDILTVHKDGTAVRVYWPHRDAASLWDVDDLWGAGSAAKATFRYRDVTHTFTLKQLARWCSVPIDRFDFYDREQQEGLFDMLGSENDRLRVDGSLTDALASMPAASFARLFKEEVK